MSTTTKTESSWKNQIINADALDGLRKLPSSSVDMCLTSPPFYNCRDYGVEGQIGKEPTSEQYINKLVTIFDEQVKRVLKPEGSLWVNLGDTISNKSLQLIPFLFALAMKERAWVCRNVIIWNKPNVIPSSAKDRFTISHDYIFFYTKSPTKYYFNTQYEPFTKSKHQPGIKFGGNKAKGYGNSIYSGKEFVPSKLGRIKRSVWNVNTQPLKENHFAAYPEKLLEVPIKAACPPNGIVLDCFFGAGTTGLVALKQGKNFIGIELNQQYCELAQKRLEPYLQQKRLIDFS